MKSVIFGFAALAFASAAVAQVSVFNDNFNRASINGGTYTYTTTATGDGGASIVTNSLVLTNDASGTANSNGRVSVSVPLSSFSAPFNSTLGSNPGQVSWTFNMQQIRSDPSGFASGGYGSAFILGGTSSDFSAGNGYAVVFGQSGATDPIRLVSYTGGLGSTTNIITATSVLTDVGAEHLSLSVTYNPSTNSWALFGRNDNTSFANPSSGLTSLASSATNTTHTSVSMTAMGAYWNFSTAGSQTAKFDEFSVSVIPEPSTYAAIFGALALVGVIAHRRRQKRAA